MRRTSPLSKLEEAVMWEMRSRTVLHRVVMVFVLAILVAAPLAASAQAIPSAQVLSRAVQEAYEKFKDVKDGANADYIPELAKVPVRAVRRGHRHRARRRLHRGRRRLRVHHPVGVQALHRGAGDAGAGQRRRDRGQDRRGAHRPAVQLHSRHPDPEAGVGQSAGQLRRDRLGEPGQGQERGGALRQDHGVLRAAGGATSSP